LAGKEEATVAVKDAPPTSEEKAAEQTTPKAEPTYNQKQLDEAVGKGRATTQSQLSVSQAETSAIKAREESVIAELASYRTSTEEDIRRLETAHEELIAQNFEDPDERKKYLASVKGNRAATERERRVTKREVDVEQRHLMNEREAGQVLMNRKIDDIIKETGIAREDLKDCQTVADVEVKGLRFQMANPTVKKEEETPQFETGISSGSGGSDKQFIEDMSSGKLPLSKENNERFNKIFKII